jgi:hypothetical protein
MEKKLANPRATQGHNPKRVLYEFNLHRDEFTGPVEFFDSDTPFPTVNRGDEIILNDTHYQVTKVWHMITKRKDEIEWITGVVADPREG